MSNPRREPWSHDAARESLAAFWRRRTRLLALQINAVWWLEHFLVQASVVGVVGAFLLLWVRSRGGAFLPVAWIAIGAAAAVAATIAWVRAKNRFESVASARVLLEDRFGLDARLSAAEAGVGDWPATLADADLPWPVRLRAGRPLARVALVAGMLAAGALVPVADADAPRGLPERPPVDAETVARWVEELRHERAIDESSAEEVAARVDELVSRPRERWYEHAGLEAAAHLREQTAADIEALARDLAAAGSAAEALAGADPLAPRDAAAAKARLADAAARLAADGLRPSATAAAELAKRSPEGLGELSPEDLARLAEALAANRTALREALARSGGFDLDAFDAGEPCPDCGGDGTCRHGATGKPCAKCGKAHCAACAAKAGSKAGRGGISRGPGTAPLSLGEERALGTERSERVTAPVDVERGAAGELLEVLDGEPAREEDWTGPTDGGAAADGGGGGAVRVDELLPHERATLRRYFK